MISFIKTDVYSFLIR